MKRRVKTINNSLFLRIRNNLQRDYRGNSPTVLNLKSADIYRRQKYTVSYYWGTRLSLMLAGLCGIIFASYMIYGDSVEKRNVSLNVNGKPEHNSRYICN